MIYPIIKGDEVIFSEDVSRPLKPLEVEGVTPEEYRWLTLNSVEHLIYIPDTQPDPATGKPKNIGAVALFCEGAIQRVPEHTLTAAFYDRVVSGIGEVEKILEAHRKETSE